MTLAAQRLTYSMLFIAALSPGAGLAADAGHDAGGSSIGISVGGIAVVAPKYEGSKKYEVNVYPFIEPSGLGDDGMVQFKGIDDLRFRLFSAHGFEAGPLVGYRFGREESDGPRLRGLGDVDGGLVLGAYAAYRAGWFMPFIAYQHQVTGDETGGLIRFGVEAKSKLSPGVTLTTTFGANYADDDYMDAYFSVTPAQSALSVARLGVFNADAGIKDVFLGVSTDVPIAKDWTLKLSARYSRLLGDAADSPIVESENQFFAGVGLTYKLGGGH